MAKERNRNTSKYGRRSLRFGILSVVLPICGIVSAFVLAAIYGRGLIPVVVLLGSYVLALVLVFLGIYSAIRQKRLSGHTISSYAGLVTSCFGILSIVYATVVGMTSFYPAREEMGITYEEWEALEHKHFVDEFKASGEPWLFKVVTFDITRGSWGEFPTMISNTDADTRCFTMIVSCLASLEPSGNDNGGCDGQGGANMRAGGGIPQILQGTGDYPTASLNPLWFNVTTEVNIPAGDVGEYRIIVYGDNARQGTYRMEAVVFKGSSDCGTNNGGTWSEYAKKEFNLIVK